MKKNPGVKHYILVASNFNLRTLPYNDNTLEAAPGQYRLRTQAFKRRGKGYGQAVPKAGSERSAVRYLPAGLYRVVRGGVDPDTGSGGNTEVLVEPVKRNPSDYKPHYGVPQWKKGDLVLYGSVRGIVELVPTGTVKPMVGVRLENGNFKWAEADDLRPLPAGEGRGLKANPKGNLEVDFLRRLPALVLVGVPKGQRQVLHDEVLSLLGDDMPRLRVVVSTSGHSAAEIAAAIRRKGNKNLLTGHVRKVNPKAGWRDGDTTSVLSKGRGRILVTDKRDYINRYTIDQRPGWYAFFLNAESSQPGAQVSVIDHVGPYTSRASAKQQGAKRLSRWWNK